MIFILWETTKQAVKALLFNKVRSSLTMLGIIIGVFSVITLVTIGEGAKNYVTDQIGGLGAGYDSFIVVAGKDASSPPNPKFLYSDINYLKRRVPGIKDIVALNPGTGDLYYGKKKLKSPTIMGQTANAFDLLQMKLTSGRPFTPAEVEARKKVAIIGPTVAKDIFKEMSPLGEKIKVRGDNYIIIGVLEKKGSIGPVDMDRRVAIPITTAQNMMGTDNITRFNIFPDNVEEMDLIKEKVNQALVRRLGNDDFRFMTQKGLLDIVNNILTALTGFVSGIAAISLIVGGIGIMNIMLVAVNERVREIGIRKAIGATKRDIILQFLIEAMLISLFGGILGIFFGCLGAFGILWYIKGNLIIPIWAVVMATFVSAGVGIFFGVYPAVRAASLDPVEALRYE